MQEEALSQIRPFSFDAKEVKRVEDKYARHIFHLGESESVHALADPLLYEPVEMSAEEREGFILNFWREAFAEQSLSLAEFTSFRVRAVWRISRYVALLRNWVSQDEFLNETEEDWDSSNCFRVRNKMRNMEEYLILEEFEGLGLEPPPIPEQWIREDGTVSPQYSPSSTICDPKLHQFLRAVERVVDYLGIRKGSREDPNQGRYGLMGIFDPALTRVTWPPKEAVMGFELVLVDEVLSHLVDHGHLKTQKWLLARHGLRLPEIQSTMRLVRAAMRGSYEQRDVEEDRILMVLKLEDFIERSKAALDLKSEAQGLKQLALVQGLGRTEPRDATSEFLEVVKRVAAKQAPEQLESSDEDGYFLESSHPQEVEVEYEEH